MEKLGFFGGCFNPVTNAHISLIKDAIEKEKLSKVYFVPMGDLYFKHDLVPVKHRIAMLKLAIQNEKQMGILDISNKNYKTSAIDSFKIIDEKFKDCERFFIMGSDNYKKIPTWKESAELMSNYKYIILNRNTGNTKDISASLARKKLKNGDKVKSIIPEQVVQYIKDNNLYR